MKHQRNLATPYIKKDYMEILNIGKNDAGQRLDKFLSKALPSLPQALMYKAIRTKKIKLNRKRCEGSDVLSVGDTIQLFLAPEFLGKSGADESFRRLVPRLRIIFEDANVIICDKAEGMICHSDEKETGNTLIDHIKAHLFRSGEYKPDAEQSFAPALCNRIDRNTGGIVIAAKTAEALREINLAIKEGRVHKRYLCAVKGVPSPASAVLRGWLVKDSAKNEVRVFANNPNIPAAREIITAYDVVGRTGNLALLEVDLLTGRTHQIRAHMAFIGHPLLGDGKYGVNQAERAMGYDSQALYSYKAGFEFPEGSPLGYLSGIVFEVPRENIGFLKEFTVK